jgi:KipI family sensor histidine kinase inhibitor
MPSSEQAPDDEGGPRVRAMGDAAILVELADLDAVLAYASAFEAAQWPGVVDVVPGARTVVVIAHPGTDLGALRRSVLGLDVAPVAGEDGATVEIPVVYDGPDLAEVAELTGLDVDEVVAAHTDTPWRVGFGGFAPGFAYLTDGDPRLQVERRSEPRTSVPAGAVGLAGEFSGVYPRSSPGGWQLIGRTDAKLWDATRTPPALLTPGAQVRFVANTDSAPDAEQWEEAASDSVPGAEVERDEAAGPERAARCDRALEVVRVGALALVQDLGRPGHAAVGVPRSGAADRAALRLANRLVANDDEGAAAIEVLLGGLAVRAHGLRTVALAGAPAPADVDGTPVGHHSVVTLRPGQTLTLGPPPTGLRTYLAVRGGVAVDAVLDSAASDTLSGLGPAPLQPGDVLDVGPEPDLPWLLDLAPVAPPSGETITLRAVLGPRADWIADADALAKTTWTVSSRSDRVGMRLEGEPLRRADRRELPSEGMVRGAIQVPPGGEPVVFLADHPVTGGYPVVAVVVDADVDRAAQARPGQSVRFRLVTPEFS